MWNPDCKKAVMQMSRLSLGWEPTGSPPVTEAPTPESTCVDINPNCPNWAEIGECDKRPEYMLVNCKKSCNNCPPPPPPPTTTTPPAPTTPGKPKCTMPFDKNRAARFHKVFTWFGGDDNMEPSN